jgi:hypothetical protein
MMATWSDVFISSYSTRGGPAAFVFASRRMTLLYLERSYLGNRQMYYSVFFIPVCSIL